MKNKKTQWLKKTIVWVISLTLLISSCSKQMEPKSNNLDKFSPSSKSAMIFDDMGFTIIDDNGADYTYTFSNGIAPNIKPGDFLIHHQWPKTHLLRKVLWVEKSGNKLTVKTEKGNFPEMAKAAQNMKTKNSNIENKVIAINEFIEYTDGTVEIKKQLSKNSLKVVSVMAGNGYDPETKGFFDWVPDFNDISDAARDVFDLNNISDQARSFINSIGGVIGQITSVLDLNNITQRIRTRTFTS